MRGSKRALFALAALCCAALLAVGRAPAAPASDTAFPAPMPEHEVAAAPEMQLPLRVKPGKYQVVRLGVPIGDIHVDAAPAHITAVKYDKTSVALFPHGTGGVSHVTVKDASGKELWRAQSKTSGEKTDYFLVLGKKGKLELYKGVTLTDPNHTLVWASEDNQASDRNGECQCHVTNSDGSPGKASGEGFSVCGLMVCRSTCAAKKDYFGDALIGTYKHGSGKCKAF